MRAETIERLALALDPDRDPVEVFAEQYADLEFGWRAATEMARNRRHFAVILEGPETWVWRAYLHGLSPRRFPDPNLNKVLALRSPKLASTRSMVEALLLCRNMTVADVAHRTGLPTAMVEGYEQLFFNVLDRKSEAAFLASVVYPRTRLVEMFDDYLKNEPLGEILKRAGYNNGPEDVLYFAGLEPQLLEQLASDRAPHRLEGVLMAHGYLLARQGWASQTSAARGIHGARGLIAAAKAGGDSGEDENDLSRVGDRAMRELISYGDAITFEPVATP